MARKKLPEDINTMYDSTSICEQSDDISNGTYLNSHLGGAVLPLEGSNESESKPSSNNGGGKSVSVVRTSSCQFRASLEERLSRAGARSLPSPLYASARRPRLQKQQELSESGGSVTQKLSVETAEKGSLTPAMRKKYLKELLLNNSLHGGFGSILSSQGSSRSSACSRDGEDDAPYSAEENTFWALHPMEHAWMLSVVDGNYETIMDYLSEEPSLLTRKDFISGFTAIHWLAKYGKHETLIKLLKHAEKEGFSVNVNLKGSGGLTPLHVAVMHSQYMVIKVLVGAFGASIDSMDYNGRRAWRYLKGNAPDEMKELLGAWDDENVAYQNVNNNSAGGEQPLKSEIVPQDVDETDSFSSRNDRWRFGSIRKFFISLGNKI